MAAEDQTGLLTALRGGIDRLARLGRSRRIAGAASVVWVVLVGAYGTAFFGASVARGTAFLDVAFFLVALALPLILIWLGAFLAEELARQRELIAALAELVGPLFDALEATRASLERHGPAAQEAVRAAVRGALPVGRGTKDADAQESVLAGQAKIAARLDALLDLASRAQAPELAAPPARRDNQPASRSETAQAAAHGQPELPLFAGSEPESPLGWDELVRALDFPRDAEDHEGFRALRRALRRRNLAKMLQAAEDVLTLLSQEGVYMDDLEAASVEPAAWRRFVAGGRGAAVAGMGGVRDAAALQIARGLMKADPIFRDTALFFQRRFDAVLGEVAEGASDAEIAALADTRSGRAFQLMSRASGSFD